MNTSPLNIQDPHSHSHFQTCSSSMTLSSNHSSSSMNHYPDNYPGMTMDMNLGKVNKEEYVEEKRVRRLVRNREAAKRNRLKKKEWIASLQHSNSKVEELNEDLRERITTMEKELEKLQGMLYQAGYSMENIPRV